MGQLANKFTWSASRNSTFARCTRKYWWTYYGSWGGWNRDADPEVRQAYMLKNLSNRWAWVGSVVHEAIEGILRDLRKRGGHGQLDFGASALPGSDVNHELDRITERMRADWRSSKQGAYRKRPKKAFGLAEHEYGDNVPREEWKQMNDKARSALRAFLQSPLFEEIRTSDPSGWLPIEQLDSFLLEGTPVWAVLDFARRLPNGELHIYDWKTGKIDPEGNKPQLGCYTLYVQARYDADPELVENHLVYLGNELVEHRFKMDGEALEATRAFVRESIGRMRARLIEGEDNAARRDDFPLTEDLSICASCTFRRLCDRV